MWQIEPKVGVQRIVFGIKVGVGSYEKLRKKYSVVVLKSGDFVFSSCSGGFYPQQSPRFWNIKMGKYKKLLNTTDAGRKKCKIEKYWAGCLLDWFVIHKVQTTVEYGTVLL